MYAPHGGYAHRGSPLAHAGAIGENVEASTVSKTAGISHTRFQPELILKPSQARCSARGERRRMIMRPQLRALLATEPILAKPLLVRRRFEGDSTLRMPLTDQVLSRGEVQVIAVRTGTWREFHGTFASQLRRAGSPYIRR